MKVEITIDRQKKLPDGAVPALEKELPNTDPYFKELFDKNDYRRDLFK